MQTIYTTSHRLGVRDNIIDLNEYRRRLGMCAEETAPAAEVDPLLWSSDDLEESVRPRRRVRRAARLSAWALDICASAGVLAMTLAFTFHIL